MTEAGIVVVLSALGVDVARGAIALLNRTVNYVSLTPTGLALYLLGGASTNRERTLAESASGADLVAATAPAASRCEWRAVSETDSRRAN